MSAVCPRVARQAGLPRALSISSRLRFLRGLLILGTLAAPASLLTVPGQEPPGEGVAKAPEVAEFPCPFCRLGLPREDFCPRCGRLSRLVATSTEHRFWGDAAYVIPFPPLESPPEINAEVSSEGLVRESVVFASGDRYELKREKNRIVVQGRVGLVGEGEEVDYGAEITDVLDDSGVLSSRSILGKVNGKPDTYLYRRLDYEYDGGGRLDRIRFKTWFYRDSSDWKKKPPAWLRHSMGEIALRRENGLLERIETKFREGKRSLRGEPEYAAPELLSEVVNRIGDKVDRVRESHP